MIGDPIQDELEALLGAELRATMTAILVESIEIKKMLPRLDELKKEYLRHYHNYCVLFGELDDTD